MAADDKFGRHELLDRACLIGEMVDNYLVAHEGLTAEEMVLAQKASATLWSLYSKVGENA